MMPHAKAAGAAAAPSATATMWTRSDDKLLEMLLVRYFPRWDWDVIASRLVGKTPEQAFQRYERVVDEVTRVLHALELETPREWDDMDTVVAASPAEREADVTVDAARVSAAADGVTPELGATKRKRGGERKKPEKWTEEEHNRFLRCLKKHGKGKWKTMSSESLTTKTAAQIASHHQKHIKRLEQRKRNGCKRNSIHDITEPTSAAAVGKPAAQKEDEPGRGVEPEAPGELVGAAEESPGEYDLGTLFM